MIKQSYTRGFVNTCMRHGVNPEALLKMAFFNRIPPKQANNVIQNGLETLMTRFPLLAGITKDNLVQPGYKAIVDDSGKIVNPSKFNSTKHLFTGAQYNASKAGDLPYSLRQLAEMRGHDDWQKRLAALAKPKQTKIQYAVAKK